MITQSKESQQKVISAKLRSGGIQSQIAQKLIKNYDHVLNEGESPLVDEEA